MAAATGDNTDQQDVDWEENSCYCCYLIGPEQESRDLKQDVFFKLPATAV